MFIRQLTGFWGQGVQRWVRMQQKHNKKLVKLFLIKPPTDCALTAHPAPPASLLPAGSVLGQHGQDKAAKPSASKWLKFSHPQSVLESGRSGTFMHYWLYLPEKTTAARMPLVVMLHGCAQTAPQFSQSTRMNQMADQQGFAVLYPQQTASNHAGRCWRWYQREVREGEAEAKSVVAIINKVVAQYALDAERIYIAGISAGAAMAQIIAINHPHLIAAVGMHSGAAFGAADTPMEGYTVMKQGAAEVVRSAICKAAARLAHLPLMPAILIHGQEDSIVRPINLAHLTEQFRELHALAGYARQNMLVKITEKPVDAYCGNAYTSLNYYFGNRNLLQVCEISELGHAWSGGDDAVNFSNGSGPDASRMMWDFFVKHHRESVAVEGNSRANGTWGDWSA